MKSRWADDEDEAAAEAQRKREKDEKKRLKIEKQQKAAEAEQRRQKQEEADRDNEPSNDGKSIAERPAKRRRLSPSHEEDGTAEQAPRRLLRFAARSWGPSRSIDNFERLNHIEEGSYGFVSRAREIATSEIVAIKKMKMDGSAQSGFPVTAIREIQTLNAAKHRHIVELREVVVGETMGDVFLVMEFLEHDLKTLMLDMEEPFVPSEIKTLMLQLGGAVEFLHQHWIMHRDLKTSNILLSNRGHLKVADFGMARFIGSTPPLNLTQLVVTLWYRAPELLLGTTIYDNSIDVWSLGCIFGELLTRDPLLQGKNEVEQLSKIFELCGVPTEESWPGFRRLPNARSLRLPRTPQALGSIIRAKFPILTNSGTQLLTSLLALNPASRPSATQMLAHAYFKENPRPKSTEMFPTFPSKAGQERRRRHASPNAPKRGDAPALDGAEVDFSGIFAARDQEEKGAGFQLRLV
ncbi:hypothetical protein LTR66_000056 [Elasticomyces elasticus]|nr:hypothetical protein LTR66_000056 [Elasticomyces elasticus]